MHTAIIYGAYVSRFKALILITWTIPNLYVIEKAFYIPKKSKLGDESTTPLMSFIEPKS